MGGLLGLTEKSSSLVRHYKRTNGSGPSEVFLVIVLSRLIDTGLQKFANMEVSEQCDSNAERLMEMGPMEEDLTDLADLPTSLIVTNMEPGVFTNMTLRVSLCQDISIIDPYTISRQDSFSVDVRSAETEYNERNHSLIGA